MSIMVIIAIMHLVTTYVARYLEVTDRVRNLAHQFRYLLTSRQGKVHLETRLTITLVPVYQ